MNITEFYEIREQVRKCVRELPSSLLDGYWISFKAESTGLCYDVNIWEDEFRCPECGQATASGESLKDKTEQMCKDHGLFWGTPLFRYAIYGLKRKDGRVTTVTDVFATESNLAESIHLIKGVK